MLAVLAFLTGGLAPALITLTPGVASAGPCGSAVAAGTTCTLTGSLGVTGASLTLTSPSSLTWSETLNGLDQSVVDTTAGDQQYTVNDATGTGAGWHVTMSATTFTNSSHTLLNTGTLSTNGSVTSISGTGAPTATCSATCTLPTNTTTYPVAIMTAASSPTPSVIYDTSASTGLGQVVIGGSAAADPVGWWLQIPASVYTGSYVSTVTLEVISGP
jgi:WxL domain surface cell wall-binding